MKKTTLIMIMGVLLLSLAVTAFVTFKADAAQGAEDPAFQGTALPTATPTALVPPVEESPTAILSAPIVNNSMIVLWDKVCVRKVPYTILSIPAGATFELVAADGSIIPMLTTATPVPGENSCKSVLVLGDRQVLVCTGQQDTSYNLRVTSGGVSEDFPVPMKACPIKPEQPATEIPTTVTPVPTLPPTLYPYTPNP